MINQAERDKLKQWYEDAIKENDNPISYEEWLEFMLIHRTQLLEQSASYADGLEAALNSILEEIPNPTLPVTKAIAKIAKEALQETRE